MINFVTSFNADGYKTYAKNMLLSVIENWKDDLHLIAYYHDFPEELVKDLPQSSLIEYRNLNDVPAMLAYRDRMSKFNGVINGTYNWRMDAIKWAHKVYALTEAAFLIADKEIKGGWLCWLDADTITTKPLSEQRMREFMLSAAELVHLGRKDVDYSETSFIGFNLDYETAHHMLGDLRGQYDIGEVISYREWHDGFIFERLLKIYTAHGMRVQNLTPNVNGLDAFGASPLSAYMKHFKGNLKHGATTLPSTDKVAPDVNLPRYRQLADIVRTYATDEKGIAHIVEVGTWNGGRAIEMALAAFEKANTVYYVGFDLFEEATEELDKVELNSKPHNTWMAVHKRLNEFRTKMSEKGKLFEFQLAKGDSKKTLPQHASLTAKATFAYIDGGHSEETVRSDYENLSHVPMIVFDDFFTKDADGNILGDEYLGTNRLVKELAEVHGKKCIVLPSQDKVKGGGHTHIAVLFNKEGLPPLPDSLTRVPIVVRPRDSMPKDYIINNINNNLLLIKNWEQVKTYSVNDEHAIIVSGGPSVDWVALKKKIKETNGKVICVKHSYPKLLEHGIQPWACVILDPRPITGVSTHGIVRKDLFKKIDKKTKFFVASMTDVSVTQYLLEHTDEVYGWHAFSEAVKQSAEGKFTLDGKANLPPESLFISGGTCSAMRAIGLFHVMGFRQFHLFGYDCSVEEPAEDQKKAVLEDGKQKYLHVETNGVKFWTTGELLAMAQDCEKFFADASKDMNLFHYGDGTLAAELYRGSYQASKKFYTDTFSK